MPANPKNKFSDNEKILCFHGPRLYEAKTLKSRQDRSDPGKMEYLVHYQGWNKNWDEWVPESRVLKMNQENLDRKEKLSNTAVPAKKDKKKRSLPGGPGLGLGPPATSPGSVAGSSSKGGKSDSASNSRASTPVSDPPTCSLNSSLLPRPTSRVQKRLVADHERSTSPREEEATASKRSLTSSLSASMNIRKANFHISIPEELKFVLVSDWDLVNHKKSLFNLPAKCNVSAILNEYQKHMEKTENSKLKTCTQVMIGIKDFFNTMLNCQLLYSIERKQYRDFIDETGSKSPSEIYGSAHLLRLMVRLNLFLNETSVSNDEDVSVIETIVSDFLSYLESHRLRLFTSKNYIVAPEEYIKSVV